MRIRYLSILLVLFCGKAYSTQHLCGNDTVDSVNYGWCIDTQDQNTNTDVLYYLHGRGGSEQDWNYFGPALQNEWNKMGVTAPTVITISFGQAWLLTDVSRPQHPALYPIFVNKIMPAMEAKIGGIKGRRMLKGDSMGGFNSSQLLLKSGNLFERVALVCPGISTLSPYSSEAEVADFLENHKEYVKKELIQGLLLWTKIEFPALQDWQNHNPLLKVQTLSDKSPKVHVSCGDKDEYGFFEGAKKFAELAKAGGADVKWQPLSGGHCVTDVKAMAAFLAPIQ